MLSSHHLIPLLLIASSLTTGCNSMGGTNESMDEVIVTRLEDERSERLRGALEAFTRNDQAYSETVLAPEHRLHMADGSDPVSLDEWNLFADASHRAFRDMEFANLTMTTTEYPEHGAWTYAWCDFLATSRVTGEEFRFPLHIMWQWDGDLVIREYHFGDTTRFKAALESTLASLDG